MKKTIVILLLVTLTSLATHGQGREQTWIQGNFYETRGNDVYIPVSEREPFFENGQYKGDKQEIKISIWHQRYYEGEVYVWSPRRKRYYTTLKKGSFWYFTWSSPQKKVVYRHHRGKSAPKTDRM